jgi:FdhD protein
VDEVDRAFALADAGPRPGGRPSETVPVIRVRDGQTERVPDSVAAEEPLEIRLGGERVAVTMRTPAPGEDAELALGFLLGEGIVSDPESVAGAVECRAGEGEGSAVDVHLRPGAAPAVGWQRNFYATSSCGICGKASIDAVRVASGALAEGPAVDASTLVELPDRLRRAQRVFDRTGGLHAAGLFDPDGEMIVLREDVGRHNAVDKVVGRAAMDGVLPATTSVLQVSGRASFEIVQKAAMAGIPIVAAVSAPSSLAVELARESRMTLVGFARAGGFNVYCGAERIRGIADSG